MATGGCVPDAEVNKLMCAVCLEQYRRPKLLPCFHTFCQSCLQAVAGPSPSFPCPACRTPVLLPPGGVAALQTNFYIEQDLGTDSTPTVRLCDVCTEDREATHACLQCQQRYCASCRGVHDSITSSRSHTVVSLQPDSQDDGNLKGDSSMREREEFCLKHRNQAVILHCTACKSNICMQCKLTSHEGHPTEDLSDTGAKVKARVREKLKLMGQQKRNMEGLLFAMDEKCRMLQSLHETTEQEIRGRRETIHQWADECQEKALKTLHSLREELMTSLNAAKEGVCQKQAAVSAQYDYATRVLLDDKDSDIISLEDQLKEFAIDPSELSLLLNGFGNEPFTCEHDQVAINTTHLQQFIGVLRRPASGGKVDNSLTSGAELPNTTPAVDVAPAKKSVNVTEMIYSGNRKSKIVAMCSTSEKRVWIKYQPSGEGEMMGLFNKEGLLECRDDIIDGDQFVTVLNDITVGNAKRSSQISWVRAGEKIGRVNPGFNVLSFPKSGKKTLFAITSGNGYQISQCSVTSLNPFSWKNNLLLSINNYPKNLLDVSPSATHFALQDISSSEAKCQLHVYLNPKSGGPRKISSYTTGFKPEILDACFFPFGGKEFLLVVVGGDNGIHVVDHTDGCNFVRYLDTGPVSLDRPRRLATDQEQVLWIGCHGGKVALLEI